MINESTNPLIKGAMEELALETLGPATAFEYVSYDQWFHIGEDATGMTTIFVDGQRLAVIHYYSEQVTVSCVCKVDSNIAPLTLHYLNPRLVDAIIDRLTTIKRHSR